MNGTISSSVDALGQYIGSLPKPWREQLLALFSETRHAINFQEKKVLALQEQLEESQLEIKYLQFDLEATKRERDALMREFGGGQQEE